METGLTCPPPPEVVGVGGADRGRGGMQDASPGGKVGGGGGGRGQQLPAVGVIAAGTDSALGKFVNCTDSLIAAQVHVRYTLGTRPKHQLH
jgi:hypothetical protein